MASNPILDFIFSPVGIILIIIIIAAVIIIFLITRKKQQDEFKDKEFNEIVLMDMKSKFKLQGMRIKGRLVRGFEPLGKVKAYVHELGKRPVLVMNDEKRRLEVDKTKEPILFDHYIFKIGGIPILSIFFDIGFKYVMVDTDFIDIDTFGKLNSWVIKSTVHFTNFGNIFISSRENEEFLSDIAMKYSYEQMLTHVANAPNRLVYLEMAHTKGIDRLRQKEKVRSEAFSKYKQADAESDEYED